MSNGVQVYLDGRYFLSFPSYSKINIGILKDFGHKLANLIGLKQWRFEIGDFNGRKFVGAAGNSNIYDQYSLNGATLFIITE